MARSVQLRCMVLATCLVAAPLLVTTPASAQVAKGDTITLGLVGLGSYGGGYYLFGPLTTVFGTTQTSTWAGKDFTVTSSESRVGNVITDLFTVSTPTNFLSGPTIAGTLISGMQLDIGTPATGGDAVDLDSAAGPLTSVGSIRYGADGASVTPLTPQTTLGTDDLSYFGGAFVHTSSAAGLYQFNIRQFDYSISYTAAAVAAVPEPASWGLMVLGFGLVGGALRQRRRTVGALPTAA